MLTKLIKQIATQYGYPRLVLSVAGGAQDFQLSSDLLHVLTRGLTAVAEATPVWLTTPGTNSGVTTYAGRTVKNANAAVAGIEATRARIPAIGLVTLGVQCSRDQMRDEEQVERPSSPCVFFIIVESVCDADSFFSFCFSCVLMHRVNHGRTNSYFDVRLGTPASRLYRLDPV